MDTATYQRLRAAWHGVARGYPPALESALCGVLEIMGDGRGVVARAVAVRDLVVVGGAASTRTAWRRLRALVDAGVLEVSREWADGPGDEATMFTLTEPPCGPITGGRPGAALSPLHPLWLEVGHNARAVLEHMTAGESWTMSALSRAAGLDRSTVRAHVREMERVGLVVAVGRRWAVAPVLDLDGAGERVDAVGAHARRVAVADAERALWHSTVPENRPALVRALEVARAALVDGGPPPGWFEDGGRARVA